MDDSEKSKQLRYYKRLATGLFLLMLLVYVLITLWMHRDPQNWQGYVQAFAEAGMVGALADWFAVTALFHHPLGIKIPHTNLIEKSKEKIGDNLGNFVVSNFLNEKTIRPYIHKIAVAGAVGNWLAIPKNQHAFVIEGAKMLRNIIRNADDAAMQDFIGKKAGGMLQELNFTDITASALHYVVQNQEHQKAIGLLAAKIKQYISENENVIREKVESESYFFVPKFIDRKLSSKITTGLYAYFDEIETNPDHQLRQEIGEQLRSFADNLKHNADREKEIKMLAEKIFTPQSLHQYATDIWRSLKQTLLQELNQPDSAFIQYFEKNISAFALQLQTDEKLQNRINGWLRYNAYKYILRHSNNVGTLISSTVGNWEGRELSQKLELEVGKDLQFIRINGTLVGGLMGLLIHSITKFME